MTTDARDRTHGANLRALAAIGLWGTLAPLGVSLATVPPFLLAGTALTIAGVLASPTGRRWNVPVRVLLLGIYGLFGFHFFLFVALRLAPPLQANLVNYLWPLAMVLLAPLFVDDATLTRRHLAGAVLRALLAITNGWLPHGSADGVAAIRQRHVAGYLSALVSAAIWATYSLTGQRFRRRGLAYPTAAIGLACLVSGLLALGCHVAFEPAYRFTMRDALPIAALAIGPMGAAFFLWDAALARDDARTVGTLAYLTPVVSTMLLGFGDPARFGWPVGVALALVVGGALLGAAGSRPVSS